MILYNNFQTNRYNPNFCANKIALSKIRQDIYAGVKVAEIAQKYDMSERTVYYIIKKFNLPCKKEIVNEKLNDILGGLVNEVVSLKKLSEQTGFSVYAIKKWIIEHIGVLPRTEKRKKVLEAIQTTKLNREIAEEFNIPINSVKSLRYEHNAGNMKKKKQEKLKNILALKEQGLSGKKIAKRLNIDSHTVYRLLKEYENGVLQPGL